MLYILLVPAGVVLGLIYQGIDRKLGARMQNRVGPPILQPIYDTLKLFAKGDIIPAGTSFLFTLFPVLAFATALSTLPFLFMISFRGDIILILYLVTMITAFTALAGFASNNTYGVIGSWREIIQLLGCEFPLVAAIIAVILDSGSMTITQIALTPHYLPFAFVAFIIAIQAKLSRAPFHIPDAETEIIAGVRTEYSGTRLALLNLAASTELFILVSLGVLLFLGVPSTVLFFAYSLLIVFVMISLRVVTARLRIGQSFRFLWLVAGPLALIDIARIYLAAGGYF